mgnify:CR=1 FL=1
MRVTTRRSAQLLPPASGWRGRFQAKKGTVRRIDVATADECHMPYLPRVSAGRDYVDIGFRVGDHVDEYLWVERGAAPRRKSARVYGESDTEPGGTWLVATGPVDDPDLVSCG